MSGSSFPKPCFETVSLSSACISGGKSPAAFARSNSARIMSSKFCRVCRHQPAPPAKINIETRAATAYHIRQAFHASPSVLHKSSEVKSPAETLRSQRSELRPLCDLSASAGQITFNSDGREPENIKPKIPRTQRALIRVSPDLSPQITSPIRLRSLSQPRPNPVARRCGSGRRLCLLC